jgi:NADH:ubiquinone oxidoreductase subunit 4 (subunit M)
MPDLVPREYFVMVPLIVMMVWMGTFPQSFLPSISATNTAILAPIEAKKEIQVRNAPPEHNLVASLKELLHVR